MYSLTPDYQSITFTQNNISYTHTIHTIYIHLHILWCYFGAKKFGIFDISSYLCTVNNKHWAYEKGNSSNQRKKNA